MSIPELREHGILREGSRNATLDAIRERFGRFQGTDRRRDVFSRLVAFRAEVWSSRLVQAVIIDRSFVTALNRCPPNNPVRRVRRPEPPIC